MTDRTRESRRSATPRGKRNRSIIAIPDGIDGMSNLEAALAYAKAGIYVLPVIAEYKNGKLCLKNPGSVVGRNWPAFSSQDSDQIRAWWTAYPDAAIAGDMGKSGLFAFDVDTPENVPDRLARHLRNAPAQSTRADDLSRGHYLFRLPKDQLLRGSTGSLGRNWGEARCAGGVIMLSPSAHEKEADGGQYSWRRTGTIPVLPSALIEELTTATRSEVPLTSTQLRRFREEHSAENGGASLNGPVRWFTELISDPSVARHTALVEVLCWAFEEARVGCYSADSAYEALEGEFREAVEVPSAAGDGSTRDRRPFYRSEFDGAAEWAAAQVLDKDPDEIWEKIQRRKTEDSYRRDVDRRKDWRRADEQARLELIEESWSAPPTFGSLADQFAEPLPENGYVVKELAGTGMTILFIAQWKAGKTTAGFNLAVALGDGTPFLERFDTALADDTTVAYWNFELDGRRAQDWFRDLAPDHPERLHVEHWRGYSLPIETPRGEEFAVQYLTDRSASVLIVDPIGSAFEGEENSTTDMRPWFQAIERI